VFFLHFVFGSEADAISSCCFTNLLTYPLHASFSIQPQVYRTIIDDVIKNVQVDFEEYGMDEEILQNLQAVSRAHSYPARVLMFRNGNQSCWRQE